MLCEGKGFHPRQFEYSPHVPDRLVFGTIRGEVVICEGSPNSRSAKACGRRKDVEPHAGRGMQVREGDRRGAKRIVRQLGNSTETHFAKHDYDSILG